MVKQIFKIIFLLWKQCISLLILLSFLNSMVYAINPEFVGINYICSLKNNGSIACWFNDVLSQSNVLPPTGNDFVQISSGSTACAIKNNGSLVCWGKSFPSTPEGNNFIQVSGTCALKSDGRISCWGVPSNVPTSNNFTQISVDDIGLFYACALKNDGGITCWGDNRVPSPPIGNNFTQISVGVSNACALKNDGSLVCWGLSIRGVSYKPPLGNNFIQVSAGKILFPSCALKNNGSIICWNTHGDNTFVPTGNNFTQVSVSASHGCGLKTDGSIICWKSDREITTSLTGNDFIGGQLIAGIQTVETSKYNNSHLFELAEKKFSEFFTPAKSKTLTLDNWEYRYYSKTDTYLGILSKNETYVLGGTFGSEIVRVGFRNELIDILVK